MRLKSYLRGIGIGILVTAAVFMISGGLKRESTMTDEQVKARAKELGMLEQITLVEPTAAVKEEKAEVKAENKAESKAGAETESKAGTVAEAKAETATPATTPEIKAEDSKKEEAKADDSKKEETKADDSKKEADGGDVGSEEVDNKTIIIVVNSGDSSETVSRKLFEAGIVADAREYDKYLMENGYDRTITVGNHKINVTASKEEIAKNLTSSTR